MNHHWIGLALLLLAMAAELLVLAQLLTIVFPRWEKIMKKIGF